MSINTFRILISLVAITFTIIFCVVVVPALINNPDVVAALVAGFVNPFASGYSADVIACWFILAFWVAYESKFLGVKYGWICLLLGLLPGVAVGFAAYLLIRLKQIDSETKTI